MEVVMLTPAEKEERLRQLRSHIKIRGQIEKTMSGLLILVGIFFLIGPTFGLIGIENADPDAPLILEITGAAGLILGLLMWRKSGT